VSASKGPKSPPLSHVDPNPCYRYPWGNEACPQAGFGTMKFSHTCGRGGGHAGPCRCDVCEAEASYKGEPGRFASPVRNAYLSLDLLEAEGPRRLLLQGSPKDNLPGYAGRLVRMEPGEGAQPSAGGIQREWVVSDGVAVRLDPGHEVEAAQRVERAYLEPGWCVEVSAWAGRMAMLLAWAVGSRRKVTTAWCDRPYGERHRGLVELHWVDAGWPTTLRLQWRIQDSEGEPVGTCLRAFWPRPKLNLPTLRGHLDHGHADIAALLLAFADAGLLDLNQPPLRDVGV